jgi:hypothetical protein
VELTSIPDVLRKQHTASLRLYLTFPFRIYVQETASMDGAMLQKATMPLGVDGGTRSNAADRIIT